jgi:multiple RNA-binding domain-containing protein 1
MSKEPLMVTVEEEEEMGKATQEDLRQKTRLIIKGLPPHVDNNRLRKIFEPFGEMTDCKVMYTKEKKSRCFGFVGYKTHKEAQKALKSLNETFVDMSKIQVSFALPMHDNNLARPWSKYSDGSSLHDKIYNKKKKEKEKSKLKDEQVNHFLGLNDGNKEQKNEKDRKKLAFWSNDDMEATEDGHISKKSETDENDSNESDEENDKIANDENISDMDYFQSKIDKSLDIENEKNNAELDEGRVFFWNLDYSTNEDELYELCKKYGEISQVHIPIDPNSKKSKGYGYVLFMIPENAEQAIKELNNSIFQGRLIYAKMANKPKTIVASHKGNFFFGDDEHLSFKQKQLRAKRIKDAMSNPDGEHENWNPMFMRADTVAESISRQIGLSKRQLLLEEGSLKKDKMTDDDFGLGAENAAVRLALGETELIKQTKEQLEQLSDMNVDLSQLRNANVKRSKRIILVKNLSMEQILTDKKELMALSFEKQRQEIEKELFELFSSLGGQVARVIVLQAGTLALVEFYEPTEARKAFRSLAYKKFYHIPLYLEWAPVGSIKKKNKTDKNEDGKSNEDKKEEESNDDKIKQSGTLFIKNLNFQTTEKDLEAIFKGYDVRSVIIARKPVKKTVDKFEDGKNSKQLGESRGFGFVEMASLDHAVKAKEALQGTVLHNHKLQLEFSSLRAENVQPAADDSMNYTDEAGRKVTFKKLVVRNVAFEATQRDLYQLFSAFGEIKDVRLPRKVSSKNQHRGFAFVEFASRKECHAAYEALKHTHLYGRPLVMEFAADDTEASLDLIKEKTRKRFAETENSSGKEQKRKRNNK